MVSFPNSDSIKHHVYSFSPAKVFELQLYKGLKADPLAIPKVRRSGVGLQCPRLDAGLHFRGRHALLSPKPINKVSATLDAPPGEYKLKIWHPRIQDAASGPWS